MSISVTYTPPYAGDFVDVDPVTKTSPTPIAAAVLENITGALSNHTSAINALGALVAAMPTVLVQATPGGAYDAEPSGATVVFYVGDITGPASDSSVTRFWLRPS